MAKKNNAIVKSAAKKFVNLKRTACGGTFPFEMQHALNLLRLQVKKGTKGWTLEEANWIFENNEISKQPNKATNKES